MNFFKILFLILPILNFAQVTHPNEIRKNIYDIIIKEIKSNRPEYTFKVIQLDSSINKFDNLVMTPLGVELLIPTYSDDKGFCKLFLDVECVDKIAIDQFALNKVFVDHHDKNYQDYYGIYAPIDSWYGVVSVVLKNAMQSDYFTTVDVIVPIKNVYFKDGKEVVDNYFYKFILDEKFKIKNYQKIKFSL